MRDAGGSFVPVHCENATLYNYLLPLRPGKLGDLLVVDGDVRENISVLEDRGRFIAVLQGGIIKAGQLATTNPAPMLD